MAMKNLNSERKEGLIKPVYFDNTVNENPQELISPIIFLKTEENGEEKLTSTLIFEEDSERKELITPAVFQNQNEKSTSSKLSVGTELKALVVNKEAKKPKKSSMVEQCKLSAYETAQRLFDMGGIMVVGDKIYIYSGKHYAVASIEELKSLIVDKFRYIVRIYGKPQFVQEVANFVRIDSQFQRKEGDIERKIVSFGNGVLHLQTKRLIPHSKAYFCLYYLRANYLTGAVSCPNFDRFLYQISGGDEVLITRIWEFFGYCLTPDTSAKSLFLLQGVPNSGKSVLTELLTKLFSPESVANFGRSLLWRQIFRFGTLWKESGNFTGLAGRGT